MSFDFKERPMPKDLLAKRFEQLTVESAERVIFGYVQYDNEAKHTNSIRNCRISHEVYVRSFKDNKFKLPIIRVSHGIMPYPVSLSFVDEILKDVKRDDNVAEWRTVTLSTEEDYKAFIEKIINDKDFYSIISSMYNL
jgi:hypothetical protein